MFDGQEGAGEIDRDRTVPHLEVEVGDLGVLPEQLHAGVRHHHVDLKPAAGGRGEPRHDTALVRDVHFDGDRVGKRCGGDPRCRVGRGRRRRPARLPRQSGRPRARRFRDPHL
jgi:hypothetical protein